MLARFAPLCVQVRADGGETELTKYTHEGVQHEVGGLVLPAYAPLPCKDGSC